jgi:hypothetical protein
MEDVTKELPPLLGKAAELPDGFPFGGFLCYFQELVEQDQLSKSNYNRTLAAPNEYHGAKPKEQIPSAFSKWKAQIKKGGASGASTPKTEEVAVCSNQTNTDTTKREPVQSSIWHKYKAKRN